MTENFGFLPIFLSLHVLTKIFSKADSDSPSNYLALEILTRFNYSKKEMWQREGYEMKYETVCIFKICGMIN